MTVLWILQQIADPESIVRRLLGSLISADKMNVLDENMGAVNSITEGILTPIVRKRLERKLGKRRLERLLKIQAADGERPGKE